MQPPVANPVVEFRDVSYRVGNIQVLSGVDLQVQRGETLVLLERSGSGKTTTLKLVNRLLSPTAGEVRVRGVPNASSDIIRLRRSIGYVIQDVGQCHGKRTKLLQSREIRTEVPDWRSPFRRQQRRCHSLPELPMEAGQSREHERVCREASRKSPQT